MKFVLLALFIGIPIAEIATFIKVGNIIGLWPTLATIILTAVVGVSLIRHQGLKTLAEAQRATQEGRMPIDAVVDGVFLLIAALLLLTPGFITDGVGFLLLWPPLRLSLAKWLWARLKATGDIHVTRGGRANSDHRDFQNQRPIIEGDVISSHIEDDQDQEVSPKNRDPGSKSPWTK